MVKINKIYSWLLAVAVFLAPFNLFFRWFENQAYLNGLFIDYLVPKLWLAEIPIILTLIIWLIELIKNKKLNIFKNKLFFLFLSLIFLKQFFSINVLISLISFFRILELIGLTFFLKNKLKELNQKLIYLVLLISFLGQILLANLQFFKQSNLFTYKILGETKITNSINIARTQFKNGLTINPYGSMAHPNILAGFLVINLVILLNKLDLKKGKYQYFGWSIIAIVSWTLFLTQAYSAIVSLVIYLTIQSWPNLKKKLSLPLFLTLTILFPVSLIFFKNHSSELSIQRRIFLNSQGWKVWLNNLATGVGLTNFFYYLKTDYSSEIVRFIQPVHHTLLLWLAETGLIGFGLLTTIKDWLKKEKTLILLFTLLPIISLDHYLMTQWIGGWLLVTITAFL